MCLNAKSIVNKKNELNIMVDITDAELGLTGCVMFRRDRIGRRGGGVIFCMLKNLFRLMK